MAGRNYKSVSLVAESDLRLMQNKLVKGGAAARGIVLCGAGEDAIGVLLNKPNTGETAEVAMIGPFIPVRLGATTAAYAEVMSDADGDAIAWVTANRSLGYLLTGGDAGDVVELVPAFNGRKA